MRYVVSPRASIKGARLLSIGKDPVKVLDLVIWNKGFTETDKAKVCAELDLDKLYGAIHKLVTEGKANG